jgi:hypothetical protein
MDHRMHVVQKVRRQNEEEGCGNKRASFFFSIVPYSMCVFIYKGNLSELDWINYVLDPYPNM